MHRHDRRQLRRLSTAKLRHLRRTRLNDQRVTLDRDTHRDDVLHEGQPNPGRAPNDPRREVHQPPRSCRAVVITAK
ncbi:hypothetical protein ACFQYP_53815 [Nonomuraea antimicrobica]